MYKPETPFKLVYDNGAYRWPDDIPLPEGIDSGERRFAMEQGSGFHRPLISLTGLGVTYRRVKEHISPVWEYTVYGDRTLRHPKEEGYQQGGRVSIGGRKRRAFTGSILVVYKDPTTGKDRLIDMATLHAGETDNAFADHLGSDHYKVSLFTAKVLAGGADKLPGLGKETLVAVDCPRGEKHAWLKRTYTGGALVWCVMPTNWAIDPETGRARLGSEVR